MINAPSVDNLQLYFISCGLQVEFASPVGIAQFVLPIIIAHKMPVTNPTIAGIEIAICENPPFLNQP